MGSQPERIGPFEIRGEIGAGGMGVVYLGWDPRLKREVAVKTLRPELVRQSEALEQFLSEARAVAAISHPHVAQIFDIGVDDGRTYFAMEYLDGRSLAQLLEERPRLPVDEAIELITQATRGLKAAAGRGVVHRDVKPSNLVLTGDGTLKVTDFGLALQGLGDAETDGAAIVGSPHYMSPERCMGRRGDLRSDIYALGATLYEMIVGRPPFVGASAVAVIQKHLNKPVPPPRELNPEIPAALNLLLLRMLSKQPDDRPRNYDVILRHLDRLPFAGVQRTAVTRPDHARGFSWAGRVAIAIALLVSGAGAWTALRPEPAERPGVGAGAAGDPREREAELTVIRNVSEVTPEGRLRIVGEVRNVGKRAAEGARARVAVVDEQGFEVESAEVPLAPDRVGPGEVGSFEALLPGPAHHGVIKVELSWRS